MLRYKNNFFSFAFWYKKLKINRKQISTKYRKYNVQNKQIAINEKSNGWKINSEGNAWQETIIREKHIIYLQKKKPTTKYRAYIVNKLNFNIYNRVESGEIPFIWCSKFIRNI